MPRGLVFGSNWDHFAQAQKLAPPGPLEPPAPPQDSGSTTDSVRHFQAVAASGKALPKTKKKPQDEPTFELRKALGLVA
jgi:hypothetical protein